MPIEVEFKYRCQDRSVIEQRLASLGAEVGDRQVQTDTYYIHPCRDYAQSDEAVRLRITESDWALTYKGPRLEAGGKSRLEEEAHLASADEAAACHRLLVALGFQPLTALRKTRWRYRVRVAQSVIVVAIDEVHDLGVFVELEMSAAEEHWRGARQQVLKLAEQLGLSQPIRDSYLELSLRRSGPSIAGADA
jgi:adenylate cyclase class 2